MTRIRCDRSEPPILAASSVARCVAPLLLLLSVIAAQNDTGQRPPAPPVPTFTLLAGDHDLGALVDLLAQIRKARIECDLEALATDARRIHLQHELRLDADAWDDVVTTLLCSRGLVIAPAEASAAATDAAKGGQGTAGTPTRVVIVGRNNIQVLIEGAELRHPDQVLARPNQIAFVRSFHECQKVQAVAAINMMRPLFASVRDGVAGLTLAVDGNKVLVTGRTDEVANALRYLRAADGQDAVAVAATPPAFAAEPASAWPERDLPADVFLAETAKVLGVNIVWQDSEVAAAAPVAAGDRRRLGPAAWYVEATRALRQIGLVLVPLDDGRRVFEVISMQGRRNRLVTQGARPCTEERVLAKDMPVEPVWVLRRLRHVDVVRATNSLRPHMRGLGDLAVCCVEDGIVLWGLSDSVAAALGKLVEIDVAPPK